MRHRQNIWIFSAATTLALCLAAPAEAANAGKHKKPVAGATAHAMKHRRTTAVVQPAFGIRAACRRARSTTVRTISATIPIRTSAR